MAINLTTISIGAGIPCPDCLHAFAPLAEVAPTFFEAGFVTCKNCNREANLWGAALRLVRQSGASFFAVTSLGAMSTSFLFDLSPGEHKELDLVAQGVPGDATVLQLGFTSQGGDCFAQVRHGNLATAQFIGPKVNVYGIPHSSGIAGGKICAGVTWIREKDSAESWLYLVDAFEAMASRKYWHVILPAHVGFEIALIPLVKTVLEKYVSKERVRDFLNDGFGISAALNIVLPLLCEILRVPRLDDDIRGQLNRLREFRNKLVHEGLPKESVNEQLAGEMLAASMFGFEYVQYLRARI